MTGTNGISHVSVDDREIGREDLQLMLQPKLGDKLRVLSIHQASLLPPGENFACCIYKVDARVKGHKSNKDNEEELHFVAKLYPFVEYVKNIFDFKIFFKKEIFFYDKLMPVFKELHREFSIKGGKVFDLTPKLYGSRLSADPTAKEVDEGVIMLMDNLKSKGYYTGNKIEGLDLEHSRATIITLSRFHAYTIACKQHRPDFFKNDVLTNTITVPFKENNGIDIFKLMLEMLFADPRTLPLQERILKSLGGPEKKRDFFEYVAEEPWLSLAHFDFWTNNVLFKKKDNAADVIDVKFIDFQNYTYNSPLRDLPYFLCTSTTHEVMTKHFNELLDLYYDTFVESLEDLRCDTSLFTRESFDKQIKIDAGLEFFHNLLAIKFFCAEIDKNTYEPSQMEKVIICSQINKLGLDKWYHIVLTYIKQGWM